MDLANILSAPPSFLSGGRRASFFAEGYLVFPELIDSTFLGELRLALDEIVERTRTLTTSTNMFDLEPDHRPDNPRLRRATCLDDMDPVFWHLCSGSVLPDIAADILGPNVRFRDLMMNFKWAGGGAEVRWHQDAPFYPHTNLGTVQFLIFLEEVGETQGPLRVVPGSHKGPIYAHYDTSGTWTGAIPEADLASIPVDEAISLTGPAGTVSVHHCLTVHGSAQNLSDSGRPAFVITYSAGDAIPYTAPPYVSSHYGTLVRGAEPGVAHHEAMVMPLPPDWSGGYTSIFEHQVDGIDDAANER